MKLEVFILGAIAGVTFSNKSNQKVIKKIVVKGSDLLVDSLNKKSDYNASTTTESLSADQGEL